MNLSTTVKKSAADFTIIKMTNEEAIKMVTSDYIKSNYDRILETLNSYVHELDEIHQQLIDLVMASEFEITAVTNPSIELQKGFESERSKEIKDLIFHLNFTSLSDHYMTIYDLTIPLSPTKSKVSSLLFFKVLHWTCWTCLRLEEILEISLRFPISQHYHPGDEAGKITYCIYNDWIFQSKILQ